MIRSLLAQFPADKMTMNIVSSHITTAAWTVVGTTSMSCDAIAVDNTSDSPLLIAHGSPGQEIVFPFYLKACEESTMLPFPVPKGTILSVKAVDHNVVTGDLVINLFK